MPFPLIKDAIEGCTSRFWSFKYDHFWISPWISVDWIQSHIIFLFAPLWNIWSKRLLHSKDTLGTHHLISGWGARDLKKKIFCCTNLDFVVVVLSHPGKKKCCHGPSLEKKVCHASPLREKWALASKNSKFLGACCSSISDNINQFKLQNWKFKFKSGHFAQRFARIFTSFMLMKKNKSLSYQGGKKKKKSHQGGEEE